MLPLLALPAGVGVKLGKRKKRQAHPFEFEEYTYYIDVDYSEMAVIVYEDAALKRVLLSITIKHGETEEDLVEQAKKAMVVLAKGWADKMSPEIEPM